MRDIPRADRFANLWHYTPGQPVPILLRDPVTGKVGINELKRYIKPFVLTTEPESITLQPGEVSQPIPMTIDSDGHFEIVGASFVSQRAEGFTVLIFDPDRRIPLMNREIHVSTIAAGGGTVSVYEGALATADACYYRWPETLWMNSKRGGRALFVRFRNLSTSENTIRFCLVGQRWYHVQAPPELGRKMDEIYRERFRTFPFFQTTEQLVQLAGVRTPGDTGNFEIRLTDEAHAEWVKSTVFASHDVNQILCRIREKKTSGRYMNEVVAPLPILFGDGVFPFLLWESNLYEPNSKIVLELQNLDSVSQVVWFTLGMRKVVTDPKEDYLAR